MPLTQLSHPNPNFDLLAAGLMHAEIQPWTTSLPSYQLLVLIAQAVFLLEYGRAATHKATTTTDVGSSLNKIVPKNKLRKQTSCIANGAKQ